MTLPRALIERVRDEALVLAAIFDGPLQIDWWYPEATIMPIPDVPDPKFDPEHLSIAFIAGAAMALGMTPLALLDACGVTWE